MCPDGSTKQQETRQQFGVVVKFNLAGRVISLALVELRFVTPSKNMSPTFQPSSRFFDMLDTKERDPKSASLI